MATDASNQIIFGEGGIWEVNGVAAPTVEMYVTTATSIKVDGGIVLYKDAKSGGSIANPLHANWSKVEFVQSSTNTLRLENSTANVNDYAIAAGQNYRRLELDDKSTWSGGGLSIGNDGVLDNKGTITQSGTIASGGKAFNSGTMSAGMTIQAGGWLQNTGTMGDTTVDGWLGGHGGTGNLTLSGTLDLTTTATGQMEIDGNLLMASGDALIKMNLTSTSSYDSILLSGLADLDGVLQLMMGSLGDHNEYLLITAGLFTGDLKSIDIFGTSVSITELDKDYVDGDTTYKATMDGDSLKLIVDVVPEPQTWALMIGALGLLTLGRRMRRC